MEENLIINKEILKYDSSHNHPEKEYDVSLSIMKHKIKDGIEKNSIPFGIKIKPLYNKISKEMGLISSSNLPFLIPEYIFDIYVIIKIKSIKNNCFGYDMKIWNYYNNMEHITNNASELFNNYLNNLFPTKPSYSNEISVLIERYKNIEAKLIDTKCVKNSFIN
ncbi:hypothetical protein H8356DRAFT_1328610 [Neocallimastix lanati (nom. inval.)]|nr:hypothetical protein H8356DRAFT_1328610 [Neocallimastix sp. JGI-2020a]